LDQHTAAGLDFAVGGRPSRFMRSDADWERYYRFVKHVASLEEHERPTLAEVRERLDDWLPKRGEWADELITVYLHGLALLDHGRKADDD
jgi:phosphoserine phosphatase